MRALLSPQPKPNLKPLPIDIKQHWSRRDKWHPASICPVIEVVDNGIAITMAHNQLLDGNGCEHVVVKIDQSLLIEGRRRIPFPLDVVVSIQL